MVSSKRLFINPLLATSLTCLSGTLAAAPDAQQQMYDRLQQQEQKRQQQQFNEMQIPSQSKSEGIPKPSAPSDETNSATCFVIKKVALQSLDASPIPFGKWFTLPANKITGHCVSITDIQAIQVTLSNALIEHGYVTSRVLIPEQDISTGNLTLLVLVGRIGDLQASTISERMLKWALPYDTGETVNLKDLEQAVENLSRLPSLTPSVDLAPGNKQGESTVVADAQWLKRYKAYFMLDHEHYEGVSHSTAQAGFELGSPFGLTDRLISSFNSDLDTVFSDRAWGTSIAYDVSRGYWNSALSYSYQHYDKEVEGVFQLFNTEGTTQITRLDFTRTLSRSAKTRFDTTVYGTYNDIQNLIENTAIQVSSYHLRSVGTRLNMKYLWGQTLLTSAITAEESWARGPATHLPGGMGSVADKRHSRYQASINASRFIRPLYSQLSLRVSTQYSKHQLFASERFSVASSSMVRGYRDIALTGNSAIFGSAQLDVFLPYHMSVSAVPFLAYDSGIVPNNSNEAQAARIDSVTSGVTLSYLKAQLKAEVSWPVEQHSTLTTPSPYTLHANFYIEY